MCVLQRLKISYTVCRINYPGIPGIIVIDCRCVCVSVTHEGCELHESEGSSMVEKVFHVESRIN